MSETPDDLEPPEVTARKQAERMAAERREEIEALYSASSRLLEAVDVESLAREIVAALEDDFGHTHAMLWLVSEDGRDLAPRATSDPGPGMPERLPLDGPGVAVAGVRAGEILNVADVTADRRYVPSVVPAGSELVIPLKVGERVLGVLDLASPRKNAFHGRDILILKAFADRAAAAIEKARLHEQLRERTRQLERFHELALMLVGDPAETYRAIVQQVLELVRTPYAGIVRFEAERMAALATVNPAGYVQGAPGPAERTPAAVVRDTRRHAIFRDAAAAFPADSMLSRNGIETYIGVPILDRRSEAVGVLYAMDTADRAFGEEELRILHLLARRAAEEMEEERRAKEKEATERMLLQSEKMASLGQVVAGVAHEINNPLGSILGLAELLARREDVSPAARETLATIVSEAERARRVVKNLLAFAREHEPSRVATRVNDVLAGTLALRENDMRVSNIEVVRELDPGLPPTLADPHLLQQAFLNLVLNAEHAMRESHGRGRLTVRTSSRPVGDGTVLRVEMEDDGPGIPETSRSRVFEPFFTTKAVGKGTGLGLSLTHSIVQQHDGVVWAEAAPGGGARFVVELRHALPVGAEEEAPAAVPPSGPGLAGTRILLADDEEALREVAREVLESEGCVVVEAADGRSALEQLEGAEFDLVVSDVKMPDVGGLEVYRRTVARRPELARRFLFVTGDWVAEDTAGFLRETGCAHLEKPYNVGQLIAKVGEVLARA